MAPTFTQAYLATEISTADRTEIIIALYEGALSYITQAMEAIESGDAARRGERITRASDILVLLCDSLDHSQPGNVAGSLFSLYSCLLRQLLEANRNNDPVALQAAHSSLTILLDAWRQVAKSPEARAIREADQRRMAGEVKAQVVDATRPTLALSA